METADVVNIAGLVEQVAIPAHGVELQGDLVIPRAPLALVAFAHGSGSSRFSRRNRYVAKVLQRAGLATLLFDLLAPDENEHNGERFNIPLLKDRLLAAIDWGLEQSSLAGLPLGLFGASTGAAAALEAAAARPECVRAVVSRGGRPDLAFEALGNVRCPTLFIVGSHDVDVLELNAWAAAHLRASHDLFVVTGASHLFSEPGALEQVAVAARDWFLLQLAAQ